MSSPFDSDALRVFLAVAETGGVTTAARRVHRTQSAVSMQIRKLEEALGQPLFIRRPRGVELTEAGRQLLPYARRVGGLLEEAAAAVRQPALSGEVRVGIPDEYSESILPNALAAFAERHPDTEVKVKCDYSSKQMAALEADELDLAVIFDWEGSEGRELLGVDPTVWTVSTLSDLHLQEVLPVAMYARSTWCKDFVILSLDQLARGGRRWRVAFECDTAGGMRTAVRSGLALAPISRSTIPEGCRELTASDGFPLIDHSRVILKRNPKGLSRAAEGLALMLREAFKPLGALSGAAQTAPMAAGA